MPVAAGKESSGGGANSVTPTNKKLAEMRAFFGIGVRMRISEKAVDKFIEKSSEPYRKLKRAAFQIKPLNVGERETIQCLRNPKNSLDYCKSVGDKARRTYRKTGKY